MKIFVSVITFLVVATFGYFFLVEAQTTSCGDFKVQTPNDNGEWERCDDGPLGSDTCTATCQAKILGWAWADTIGWISFGDESCKPEYVDDAVKHLCPSLPPAVDYNIIVGTDKDGTTSGWAWSDNVGWICFGNTGDLECDSSWLSPSGSNKITLDFSAGSENPPLQGWARIISLGQNGWISLNCADMGICDDSDFKVVYSQANFNGTNAQTLNGWGWNDAPGVGGIGWIQFNPPIEAILPWLQTKYGDIYARGDISGKPIPNTAYNATYRILSGGSVKQFSSLSDDNLFVSPFFGPIDFPTPDTRYSNVLGQLDIDDLLASVDNIPIINDEDIPALLGGEVYHTAGSLVIDGGIPQFNNGANFEDGSGTIIVEGDLIINNDIIYDSTGGIDRFRNLASVAWIVLGDLQISGAVDKLAGNFIVLGNNTADCSADPPEAGCGQVFSCFSGSCGSRLTVSGLMMAKIFKFDRTFTDLQGVPIPSGSEIIIYDGRLLANTPPGLGDFAKALPIWRAGTFER